MLDRTDEIRWRVAAAERDELRAHGDLMQSSLSRVIEWVYRVREEQPDFELPYEVGMALHEGFGAVAEWTAARSTNWPGLVKHQLEDEAIACANNEGRP